MVDIITCAPAKYLRTLHPQGKGTFFLSIPSIQISKSRLIRMSYPADYFEAQKQLTAWTDELEFLSYIVCELIDAERLNAVRHECHQAADFPALSKIIRLHLKVSNRSLLAHIMNEDELKSFRRLLKKATQIRNISAHHGILKMDKLNALEDVKQRLSNVLEVAIKRVASDLGIDEVCLSAERYLITY